MKREGTAFDEFLHVYKYERFLSQIITRSGGVAVKSTSAHTDSFSANQTRSCVTSMNEYNLTKIHFVTLDF